MLLYPTTEGYWIASGNLHGRLTLAEGHTRKEEILRWCDEAPRQKSIYLVKEQVEVKV